MNEQSEFSNLFSQVTLKTPVEDLTTQLENTIISSTSSIPSLFSFSTPTDASNNHNHNTFKIPMTTDNLNTQQKQQQQQQQKQQQQQQQQQQEQLWINNNDNINNNNDDGWGEAPSYTSILPYVEFGFTSNMIMNQSSSVNIRLPDDATVNINPNQPFGRFKNTPVTFNSNPN